LDILYKCCIGFVAVIAAALDEEDVCHEELTAKDMPEDVLLFLLSLMRYEAYYMHCCPQSLTSSKKHGKDFFY
jgi:hypothetical protein